MKKSRLTAALALTGAAALTLTACDQSEVVSHNLSKEADNFQIERRIVFVNGVTDKYLLEVQGRCSILDEGHQLEVTCKVGEDSYKKHFLGLSDNVTYFAEQIETAGSDPYHYTVIFRPETLIPSVELDVSADPRTN